MKKFLSVACCFGLIGSGVVNVGQAVEENTPKFVELTIDDDGYFHYKWSDNEGKLGVYLADFMGYGPKITLSERSIVESLAVRKRRRMFLILKIFPAF